jgi:membrane associated rhomboid family serine protease
MIVVLLPDSDASWRRTPWLWALMGANAAVLVAGLVSGETESIIDAGALDPKSALPWTFVTSLFLHGSAGHFAGNMLFLWGVGQPIHQRLGAKRFLLAYTLTGLAAGAAYVLSGETHPVIGSSGAVSGMMGLYAVLWPRRRMRIAYWIGKGGLLRPRAYWALGLWVLLQVWLASRNDGTDRVAYSAHLGGFAAGAAMGLVLRVRVTARLDRAWMLETPEPDQETRAGHLARAVLHNSQVGAAEPMTRAWDDWESGGAHVGFSDLELARVRGEFLRRGDQARAGKAAAWMGLIYGRPSTGS